jgi:adenosylhomocysteinase
MPKYEDFRKAVLSDDDAREGLGAGNGAGACAGANVPGKGGLEELAAQVGYLDEKINFLFQVLNELIVQSRKLEKSHEIEPIVDRPDLERKLSVSNVSQVSQAKPSAVRQASPNGKFSVIGPSQQAVTQNYKVKDLSLADQGRLKIEYAEGHMPVLMKIRKEFETAKPLRGLRVAAVLHVTKETAVLMRTLKAGGADVALAGSNPLSTQDDVAAALAKDGIKVFAWRGTTNDEYYWCLNKVLDTKPNVTMDDGADLVSTIHSKRMELMQNVIGGQEETTTGVIRLRAMAADGALKYPVVAVNDTPTKRMFDNHYGTGQSTLDGIIRSTNVLLAGKNFVVSGYGYCSSGIAKCAAGMGSNVIITEVDPTKALKATMDGFRVMPILEAARIGDIFVTATGDKSVIRGEHMILMKDGAILANSGHFNVEISVPDLEKVSVKKRKIRDNVEEFTKKDGKRLYFLAEGRLVNLAAAEGHPSEVMDMSFADQALVTKFLAEKGKGLQKRVHEVPEEIDRRVAKLKLESMGVRIDDLTSEQMQYLTSWKEGT